MIIEIGKTIDGILVKKIIDTDNYTSQQLRDMGLDKIADEIDAKVQLLKEIDSTTDVNVLKNILKKMV